MLDAPLCTLDKLPKPSDHPTILLHSSIHLPFPFWLYVYVCNYTQIHPYTLKLPTKLRLFHECVYLGDCLCMCVCVLSLYNYKHIYAHILVQCAAPHDCPLQHIKGEPIARVCIQVYKIPLRVLLLLLHPLHWQRTWPSGVRLGDGGQHLRHSYTVFLLYFCQLYFVFRFFESKFQ